ncbi:MAG: prephenate dehydratase [Acidobacteriota bacterium]
MKDARTDPSPQPDLQQLREGLETIDHELLELLRRRMESVEAIALAKMEAASPFRDQEREDFVLTKIRRAAVDVGLDARRIESLYRQIMEMSISHQQAHVFGLETTPLRVAYQGIEGSYSHLAARRRYRDRPGGCFLTGYESVAATAAAVQNGEADFAFLPIENSTAGSINETWDALAHDNLTINAEVISSIQHCLLALPGVAVDELRTVISHPQALGQCEVYLRTTPWIKPVAEFDTAGSARKVKETGDRTLAAIASEAAAERNGLEILAKGIQTQADNATRFVEVAIEGSPCPVDVPCKTSFYVTLADKPGSLCDVLTCLKRRGIGLTKLESRPIPEKPWAHRFYLDIDLHADETRVTEALEEIEPLTTELKLLGTYPRADVAQSSTK